MSNLLSGKEIANAILNGVGTAIAGMSPGPLLADVVFGSDESCIVYAQSKAKTASKVGIRVDIIRIDENIDTENALRKIESLSEDEKYHGIILEEPFPKNIESSVLRDAIPPVKDVDCATSINLGKLLSCNSVFEPATPLAVIELLKFHGIVIEKKHVVVVGRSRAVGIPLANMLLQKRDSRNATVTVCHSGTRDLHSITKSAEILVVAAGSPKLIKKEHISPGTVVVDVGTNYVDGKLVGDVDFESVQDMASAITPVPGGVGPVTVACLIRNVAMAFLMENKKFSTNKGEDYENE